LSLAETAEQLVLGNLRDRPRLVVAPNETGGQRELPIPRGGRL
jgi:hypothetical protein